MLELAGTLGIPAREQTLGRFDFFAAEEAFLTGTGAGIVPLRSLDGRLIGAGRPGPICAKLRAAYADATLPLGVPV